MTENKATIRAKEYNKAYMVRVFVLLNKKTDSDIIEALETVPSKNALIKKLLRKHFFGGGKNE